MAGPWRRFVVRPIVWLVAAAAAALFALHLFLGSDLARTRAQALLEARLGEALGRKVTIERVDFSLLPLWIALDGVTIAGDRPDAPPFARVARAEIDADWHGVRERVLELTRVSLQGLELDLEFRADGSDNVPRPPRREGGTGLQVRLGGLYVEQGRVHLDEETAPFALAAEAVDLRASGLAGGALDATVAAARVELRLPGAQPLDTAFAARVRLRGERLEIVRARLSAPDLALVAHGAIGLERPVTVDLTATAEGSGALLDRLGWLHGELDGAFRFDGEFALRARDWTVRGGLTSPALDLLGFELAELSGRVDGSRQAVRLEIERAGYAGGALAGSFEVALARPHRSAVELVAGGVEIQRVLDQFDLPVTGVRGVASGPFRYDFDLLAAGKGDGSGSFVLAPGADGVDVGGSVELRLAAGELELPSVSWRAGAQSVTGSGRLALAGGTGRFDLAVASEELGGLVGMLPFLPPGELWVPTAGTAQAQVALTLAPGAMRADVELEAAAMESPGVRAERVVGRLSATESAVAIESLALFRPGGRLELSGTVPLEGPGAPPLALELAVTDWPVEDAAPWLPFELPLAGRASGTLALGGSLEALRGRAELAIDGPKLAGLAGRRLDARFDFDPAELRLAEARFELDAGVVTTSGTIALDTERLAFRLDAPALALDRAPFDRLGSGRITGRLALDASLAGTLSSPDLTVDGTFTEFAVAGEQLTPAPGVDGESVATGAAAPRLAARWADGKLDARLELPGVGRLAGGGALDLESATRLEFEFATERLDRLVALATGAPVEQLEGGLAATVTVELPVDGTPTVTVVVPAAEFAWRGRQVRSLEPIRARLDGDALTIDSVYLGLDGGADEFFLSGGVRLDDDPRLDLHLQADFGAELVRPWIGELDIGGRLSLLADLEGTVAEPALRGQGEWSAGRFVPGVVPHVLDRGQALVLLYPDAIVLDRLTGHLASGEIEASGRIDLAGGAASAYRFELAARRLALRWPPGWQTRGDAELTLASTPSGRQISGQVRFDRLYYFQDIDLSPTQLIERLLARSRVVVPDTDELLATTALNVAVRAPESVRVRNNVADLVASADLALKGSLARPVLFGDVRTAPGGRVTYGGNRYEIERGLLTFADATRIDPQLDILARTKVDEYDVALILGGPLSRPVASFTSDPPLADLEVLGLLTTGATPTGALFTDRAVDPGGRGSGSATGAVGAESLLYGQAATMAAARVGRLFGFDQVRVEPLTSGDAVSTARVTVGKRLSRRLFVTYSVDPTSTAQEILQAEYRVSDRLVLVLTQNGSESYSIDARWESRF